MAQFGDAGADLTTSIHTSMMTPSTYPASRRAAVLSDFGEAHNFSVREVPTPALRSDEMLVRVKATSVNPIEWKMRRGLGAAQGDLAPVARTADDSRDRLLGNRRSGRA